MLLLPSPSCSAIRAGSVMPRRRADTPSRASVISHRRGHTDRRDARRRRLRCEQGPLALDPPAEATNHRLDDAVVTEADAAVSENLHRRVVVVEMPGEPSRFPRRRTARFHDRLSGTGAVAPLGLTCFARTRPDSILLSGSGGVGDRGTVSARTERHVRTCLPIREPAKLRTWPTTCSPPHWREQNR